MGSGSHQLLSAATARHKKSLAMHAAAMRTAFSGFSRNLAKCVQLQQNHTNEPEPAMKMIVHFQGWQAPDLPMSTTASGGNFLANAMWCPERKLVQALAIQETLS
jgi:hypothetical protein